jgi:hypothetical protein
MRGDAVIYIWDKSDVAGAIGYHDKNNSGIPFGFVFVEIAKEVGESWTVTLSHEAFELILDPEVNLLVLNQHPDPAENGRSVFHWYLPSTVNGLLSLLSLFLSYAPQS